VESFAASTLFALVGVFVAAAACVARRWILRSSNVLAFFSACGR
jgi:hypothetical protein